MEQQAAVQFFSVPGQREIESTLLGPNVPLEPRQFRVQIKANDGEVYEGWFRYGAYDRILIETYGGEMVELKMEPGCCR